MKNLICLINSYLAFFIFHLFFLHFSMTTLLQLGVYISISKHIYPVFSTYAVDNFCRLWLLVQRNFGRIVCLVHCNIVRFKRTL